MGKLSAVANVLEWIRSALILIWAAISWLYRTIGMLVGKIRNWLRSHIPFVEAIIQRHIHNPATIFIDIAVSVLVIYLIFGVIGYASVYKNKSNSRFTETLAAMYPLPAVKVDSSFVWSHKFLQRLRFLDTFNDQGPKNVAQKLPNDSELRQQIVSGLIEDQIILLEATERGVRVTEEELDSAFEAQKKQTKDFEATLKKLYGMSAQEFKQVIAERILKEKVKGVVLTRIKVRHILTSTESAANEARQRLVKKDSFAAVAKKYSEDSQTKNSGGELGYWTKGELAAAVSAPFETQAFKLKVNAISQPIQTKYGYHIVQVTERSDNEFKTYKEWYEEAIQDHKITVYIPY